MPEGRSRTLLWILIGGGAFFLFVLAVFTLVYLTLHAGGAERGDYELRRPHRGGRSGWRDFVAAAGRGQLKKFGDDSSIKAIIHPREFAGRWGGRFRGDLPRGQAHPRREKEAHRGFDRDRWARAARLCGFGVGQDLCRSGQHCGIDRRDRAMGELWRSAEVGQAERCGDQDRRVQGYGQSGTRSDAERAGLHAVADRQHVRAVRAGGAPKDAG